MKCPVCFALMECRSKVRRKIYADFHCFNPHCAAHKTRYCPHIEVAMIGGKAPWHCLSYHLPFKDWDDSWVVIEGSEKNKETTLYDRYSFLMSEKKFVDQVNDLPSTTKTIRDKATVWEMTMLVSVNQFLPLPINDKIPETAKDLLWKMRCLDPYEDYQYSSTTSYTGSGYYNHVSKPEPLPAATAISNNVVSIQDDVIGNVLGRMVDEEVSEMGCYY